MDRVVICMKWGTLYGPDYVNVLYSACREYITGDFRFVCLTDDVTGIREEVETFPIPDMGLSAFDWKKGGWPKLSVFARDLYGLKGRALFVDLDTVLCGPMDPLFEVPGDIVVIDSSANWKDPGAGAFPVAMTSVFAFTLGQHPEILEQFQADHVGMVAKYRIEQVYLQGVFPDLAYWPHGTTISFKYDLRRGILAQIFLEPRKPKPNNIILAFHGEPRPIDLVKSGWWGIAPHLGRGPVSWMRDYWVRHGGQL